MNVAVTEVAALTVTEQAPVPVHAPDQPVKTWPARADCVSVTVVPLAIEAEQVPGQEMPPVLEVTVPPPPTATDSVKLAGGATATSTAPMSQWEPCGRATPRWSSAGQAPSRPASSAGLAAPGRYVSVCPPLFASAPSCGSTPCWSPAAARPQLASDARFEPCESSDALQSLLNGLLPKIVLIAITSAPP